MPEKGGYSIKQVQLDGGPQLQSTLPERASSGRMRLSYVDDPGLIAFFRTAGET